MKAASLQVQSIPLEGQAWEMFAGAIKSKHTLISYSSNLEVFFRFLQSESTPIQTPDDVLKIEAKQLEALVIKFIMREKALGRSSSSLNNKKSAIALFLRQNDKDLNFKRIGKYMPEKTKTVEDRAYSRDEIAKLLDVAPLKLKSIILMLASTGCRVGALPGLKLKHLKKMGDLYRVKFYVGTRDEYYSFMTPEATRQLDLYLQDRASTGEKLTDESLVYRDQYQRFYGRKMKGPRPITGNGTAVIFLLYARKAGIRQDRKGKRGETMLMHAFRKFFTSEAIRSGLDPLTVDMLLGHKVGLMNSYYRPTEQEMLCKYEKAIRGLSINDTEYLKDRVEQLEREQADKLTTIYKALLEKGILKPD